MQKVLFNKNSNKKKKKTINCTKHTQENCRQFAKQGQ